MGHGIEEAATILSFFLDLLAQWLDESSERRWQGGLTQSMVYQNRHLIWHQNTCICFGCIPFLLCGPK